MASAIVAAAAALAGVLVTQVTGLLQGRRERAEWWRERLLDALSDLLAAGVDHRRHQYLKIAARREGLPDTRETREARYEARSSVTRAMAAVQIATRDREVLDLAHRLVDASFALGDAADSDVDAVGDAARDAHNELLATAAHLAHRLR
ncbi:hypothetical protein [Streptomyces sp. CC224B]|uniref:hypothetical protein n=1 Tax=Streptomyces sp. CC224B TaxID=3044571 RepID=UPI0024A9677A|nr:hypothetical protein [Streptomyces sp. CC224B]